MKKDCVLTERYELESIGTGDERNKRPAYWISYEIPPCCTGAEDDT